MIDLLLALLLPFLLMVAVTRVTFSVYGALIVTAMVMLFAFDLYQKSIIVIIISIISLVGGWFAARKLLKKKPGM
ncbi:DUF2198 family protein [Desertibacillus haloalkaliphilus]|uniref:DUF2198 family protein n=1 Tax=Desertibacillus haloalkaliphilus TaxID=1328930 RepID=UPI001C2540B4|nr:DUF2198 family protein [Desertibacillus haloalkaliphilus]MBU8908662.1 DUF2198 family protein [Desertibacillus haloalkaliphilus]